MLIDLTIKLMLSFMLGAVIGFEREHVGRPAGLRTHVLVCVSAALVQVTSLDYYASNPGISGDPFRLGAQVISGIGFLGAGTIIKAGASVKGLTTAATIWAVGCIGLAVGTGMYIPATAATILLYIGLKSLKELENRMTKPTNTMIVQLIAPDVPGKLGEICDTLGALNINILGMDIQAIYKEMDKDMQIDLYLTQSPDISNTSLTRELSKIPDVRNISFL